MNALKPNLANLVLYKRVESGVSRATDLMHQLSSRRMLQGYPSTLDIDSHLFSSVANEFKSKYLTNAK